MPPLFLSQKIMLFKRMAQLVVAQVQRLGRLPLIIPTLRQGLLEHRLFISFGRFSKIANIYGLT